MTAEPAPAGAAHAPGLGVEAEAVDAGYLQKRELRGGTAGWLLLAGLGVSAVISAMPRGIVAAMGVLVLLAVLMLVFTPGAGGSAAMSESGNPPVDALAVGGGLGPCRSSTGARRRCWHCWCPGRSASCCR